MVLKKRGKYRYGDSQTDIREELLRYSKSSAYIVHHLADAACKCGGKLFRLALDDTEGVAVRTCIGCRAEHPIGEAGEYLEGAELAECACPCGAEEFEITAGVSLYEGSEDVRWIYVGCRCAKCGLTAVYGDWKNEFEGYQELLARVYVLCLTPRSTGAAAPACSEWQITRRRPGELRAWDSFHRDEHGQRWLPSRFPRDEHRG